MKKTLKILGALAVTAITALNLTGCSKQSGPRRDVSAAKPLVFRMSMNDGENTVYYKGAKEVADRVFQKTNGKIVIKVIPGGTLGAERSAVELAMNGDLDIATAANSVLSNWIPGMSILDQAYLWKNTTEAHAAVDGKVGQLVEREAQRKMNIHVIGYMESGFRDIFSTKPIDKPGDFNGIKIRTMQNRYHMAAFRAFGAMPVAMPFGEQFTALQQGTIDACENGVSGCYTNGFYEVTKHITNSKHAFVYILLCMSDKSWSQIPDDLRRPFLDAVREGCQAERNYLQEANDDATTKLKEKGVTFHDIDIAKLQELYRAEAKKENFNFDPEWQAAVDDVLKETTKK